MDSYWDDIPNIQSLEELHTTKELAEILRISPNLIHKWRLKMGMPYIRFGKFPYFSETQVVHWMNNYQRTVPDRQKILGITLAQKARTGLYKKKT